MELERLYFQKWGVVDWGYTTEAAPISLAHYNHWVEEKRHLPLSYMEGERQEIRQGLNIYWPDFKAALVFLFSYKKTHEELKDLYQNDSSSNGLKVASYTLGFKGWDYHLELKKRLEEITLHLQEKRPGLKVKLVLDTQPVLERDLAYRAGLGWFGKNSMLINQQEGSFFIIGTLLLDQELPDFIREKKTVTDHCGHCTRCVGACPTGAIDPQSRTIIARDCISTFTIEQFKLDTVAPERMNLDSGFIFGCDICQDVCPWNKKESALDLSIAASQEKRHVLMDFFLRQPVEKLRASLFNMSERHFRREMAQTSFERSGRRGVLKNVLFKLKDGQ